MTANEMRKRLTPIFEEANVSKDRDVLAAAGVLAALIGSICINKQFDLLRTVQPFAHEMKDFATFNIARIKEAISHDCN